VNEELAMPQRVIALGELLVEVMRQEVDQPLSQPGALVGPFPSGAPAIFIDAVARLGQPAGFIGEVGAEATLLTGDADQDTACRALVAQGIPIGALKRGEPGSALFTADQVLEVPSLPVTEVDPTGAEDCYGGAFVVGLLEGWDLAQPIRQRRRGLVGDAQRADGRDSPARGNAGTDVKKEQR